MENKNILKILFVEDLPSDAELAILELRKNGLKFEHFRVDTRVDFFKAFNDFKPDIIISDYMMPSYDGMRALSDSKEIDPQIPFIILTGSINEETAVKCIQAGADDYIIKEHLTRLPYAVNEVLEKSLKEKEKRAAELLLTENEEKLQSIFRAAPVGIGLVVERVFMEVNDTFCSMTGYTRKELIGKSAEMIYATKQEFESVGIDEYRQIEENGIGSVETRFKCKDGRIINILMNLTPLDKSDLPKGVTFTAMDITERVQTEEALQKIQHLFQTLAQVSPVGIFRTDPDGNTTYVNPKWTQLSGLSSEEAIGNGWLNAVHPEDREKLKEEWVINFKYKDESGAEYRFLRPDGSTVWVMGKAVPELIGNEVIGYIGTITDITERKQSEEVLRKSNQIIEGIINAIPVRVFWKDENLLYLGCNTIFAHDSGFDDPAELIGKSDYQMGWHEQAEMYRADDKQVIESGLPKLFIEESQTTPKGNIITLLTSKIPLVGTKGEIYGVLGTYIDITERKQVEEALRESEEKFRLIMENSADAILISDQQGKFVYTNKEVTAMLGYTSDEMKKKTIIDLSPQNRLNEYFEILEKTLNEGKVYTEIELLKKDGNFISTDLNAVLLPGGLVYGSCRDITERKHAKEELIKAKDKAEEGERLKTSFLQNISHEIRTPMNAIVGFTALLGDPEVDTKSREEYIEIIMQSSNHLLTIVSDIMDISNIEANIVKIVKSNTNVNSILQSLFDQFMPKANEKKIKLVCETALSDSDALVLADSTKLKQILINLINNAIKFTDKGYVKVGCVLKDKFLEFNVSDSGIGISEQYQHKIFDRFYQVQQSVSKIYEGTGLGLAISKAHVELMGGKLWLTSEPGMGSSFYLTIPYEKQVIEALAVNEKRVPEDFVFPENKTILVAEDSDSNFKLIEYFLSDTNTKLLRAKNGKEAVEIALDDSNIDLILMDIKMPFMDGYTAAGLIRTANIKIPIIAQTAYANDREKAIEAGCNEFILKPLDKSTLLKKIGEFI